MLPLSPAAPYCSLQVSGSGHSLAVPQGILFQDSPPAVYWPHVHMCYGFPMHTAAPGVGTDGTGSVPTKVAEMAVCVCACLTGP